MMFNDLETINFRPRPFEFYTAKELWADEHISKQMLKFHLNDGVDLSSRNSKFIDSSVGWIAERFQVGEDTQIADFGCGPGLYTSRLARLGARVTGIDFSSNSLEYAKKYASDHNLAIRYLHQNYLDYQDDRLFDLVIMIMCDFCALSPDQRSKLLGIFHRILKPGGSVLLDGYTISAFDERREAASYEPNLMDGFWSPEKYYGFINTFKYEAEKVVLDKYTIVGPARVNTIYNWLQYFSFERLEREFDACGFAIAERYADVAGSEFDAGSMEFAVVAQKK